MIDLERQFNNHLRKRSVRWTAISAGLLMALGGTMTVTQANAVTNHVATKTTQPRLSNDSLFNSPLRINLKPAVFNYDTPNLAGIDKHADVLHQQILTDAVSRPLNLSQTKRVTRSVNADHVLNMSKTFRETSAPQTLSLPKSSKSSNKRQIKHNRSVLTSRLQILIILYAVLSNFVDVPRIRNGAASNDYEPKEAPLTKPQSKTVKVTITFRDVYGEIDGLKVPEAITKKGTRNKGYSVSAPDGWALIEPNGTVTDRLTFYYRDGDQTLAVVPCYKGVTYKYDRKAGCLEFIHGSFSHVKTSLPPEIAPHAITSIKFNQRVHVNIYHLRSWFSYYSNLRTLNIKGHVIDRQPEINGEGFRSRIRDVEPSDRSSQQAETGALDELSMMIGELSNEDRK